jgi:hypothetical protein
VQYVDETAVPLIDAHVHIFFPSNQELRTSVMQEPFASRGFPDYEMDWYGAPGGENLDGARDPDDKYPGSDPEWVPVASVAGAAQ